MQKVIIRNKTDILLVFETKLNVSQFCKQYCLGGFDSPCRRDRNNDGDQSDYKYNGISQVMTGQ